MDPQKYVTVVGNINCSEPVDCYTACASVRDTLVRRGYSKRALQITAYDHDRTLVFLRKFTTRSAGIKNFDDNIIVFKIRYSDVNHLLTIREACSTLFQNLFSVADAANVALSKGDL